MYGHVTYMFSYLSDQHVKSEWSAGRQYNCVIYLFLCQTFFTMLSLCLYWRNEVVGETMYVYFFYCNGTDNWQSCPYICYVHSVPWNCVMTIILWSFTIRPYLFFPFQYGLLFFLSGFMDIVFILNKCVLTIFHFCKFPSIL